MYPLLYTRPLPTRCCSGIFHCQPAERAVDWVYGASDDTDSVCTATALSFRSQCDQSSQPVFSSCSISNPRKPVQSMNRSPATTWPDSSATDSM